MRTWGYGAPQRGKLTHRPSEVLAEAGILAVDSPVEDPDIALLVGMLVEVPTNQTQSRKAALRL